MFSVVIGFALWLPAADTGGPVAMVLSTKGAVTREHGKAAPHKIGAMALLVAGDGLNAHKDAEAVLVFLGDGHRERLKGGAKASVQSSGLAPADAAERLPGVKLPPANMESLRDLARSARAGVGVLRGDRDVQPLVVTPIYGAALLTDRPKFSWPAAKNADAYLVELLSGPEGRDQRLVWKATTKETQLTYPEKQKSLQLGLLYRWRVSPTMGENQGEPIVVSKFALLTKGEIEALSGLKALTASKAPEDWVTAAALYEAHGAIGQALPLYEKLAERFPREPAYQVALASYYQRAGRLDRAKKASARAKELGAEVPAP